MDHDRCGSGARWCARADAMFNSDGMHVLDVQQGHRKLVITVESEVRYDRLSVVRGCAGRDMAGDESRPLTRRASGCRVMIVWLKRIWRCVERDCPQLTLVGGARADCCSCPSDADPNPWSALQTGRQRP